MSERKLISIFQQHIKEIKNLFKIWLIFSISAVASTLTIVFFWKHLYALHSPNSVWAITSFGIILFLFWWSWTIQLVFKVLKYQSKIMDILLAITNDIKKIRKEFFVSDK